MSSNQGQRELVFCHECDNEWYKDERGLKCPSCQSDFVEVIEPDSDPRREQEPPMNPLFGHNPWSNSHSWNDGNESFVRYTIQRSGSGPPIQVSVSRRSYGGDGGQGQGPPPQFFSLHNNFARMYSQITGAPMAPGMQQPGPFNMGPDPFFRPQSAPGNREDPFARGPASPWSSSDLGLPRGLGDDPHQEIHRMMNSMFAGAGQPGANANPGSPGGVPPNPLGLLLRSLMGPMAGGRMGDAAHSQEQFDQIISQLMEQHQSGNAPGPATETAIASLPKKKLTSDMLDENTGKAECSICMDNIPVGDEVTTLPCSHWFHFPCVEAWLKEHDTCPICRAGITPKDGSRDTARSPAQQPLYNHDPFELARQESGTREHPYVVPDSPTSERRQRPLRRASSGPTTPVSRRYSNTSDRDRGNERRDSRGSGGGGGGAGNEGFGTRIRNFLSGAGGNTPRR